MEGPVMFYAQSDQPIYVLVGHRVVTIPPGNFSVRHNGERLTVKSLDRPAGRLLKRGLEMTDLSEIAARLGMRVSAQPKPAPAPEPVEVASKAPRPVDIVEMVGQDTARVQMMLDAQSALTEREHGDPDAMPAHTLLSGPPGTGKTTLAKIIARILGGRLIETTASAVKDVKVLARELAKLRDDDVFFVDEIHGLPRPAQELLYTAMEDGTISVQAGEGVDVTVVPVRLNRFMLVGATTIRGKLEGPILDRFGLICELTYYSEKELRTIISGAASKQPGYRCKIDDDAVEMLASRAKGTPRIALSLLKRARTYVFGMNRVTDLPVTCPDVETALQLAKIDNLGLEEIERSILRALCAKHNQGRGMSIENIAAVTGLEDDTVKQIEPLLIRLGLMVRTSRGRKATKEGYEHIGERPPVDAGIAVE
jgi:Holliday junction DNA helicase RuvB